MDKSKVNMAIMQCRDYVSQKDMYWLMSRLEKADDSIFDRLLMLKFINPTIVIIVSIFFGVLGIDRFMVEDYLMGVFKFALLGIGGFVMWLDPMFSILIYFLAGIWAFCDIFLCYNRAKEVNAGKIIEILKNED
ncbi:MAG: TM2 domain-containing protein [Clostridia bacterium]|nr:TM2 domain-containing protein [Clostridia bacterium]